MRFRRLTIEELEQLEMPFVQFLAINGIDADLWQTIKTADLVHKNELLDAFSDMVLLKSLKNISTLEHRTERTWRLWRFTEAWAFVLYFTSSDPEKTNLSTLSLIEICTDTAHIPNIELRHGRKVYAIDRREDELFAVMETEKAWIGNDTAFDSLWEGFDFERFYRLN